MTRYFGSLRGTTTWTPPSFTTFAVPILAILAIASTADATEPSAKQIDSIFAEYDKTVAPGCALGVIRDGEFAYKRGYGMANLEYGIALSPSSVFRTASVGKQFTAMAIAILDREGVLSLDDSLNKYFPEFPDWAEGVSIRHLVHHTSGIRDYLTLAWLAGQGDEAYYTDEYALDLLVRQRHLNFAPGEQHLYSNSGYLLLAHIVKRVTGKSLREWAAENMFGPLGMQDSHFHDDHTHIVPLRADGYAPTDNGYRISMTILDMVGDGGVYTTIDDFLFWDRNFYNNRLAGGGSHLIKEVTTPANLNDGENLTYAFGLDVDEYRGLTMVSHGGGFVGFRTDTIRFPEQRFSVAVYCNRADAEPGQLARKVAALYLADEMDPDQESPGGDSGAVSRVQVAVAEFDKVAGRYWNEERRTAREVLIEKDKLYLVFSEGFRTELIPQGNDRFLIQDFGIDAEVQFESTSTKGMQMQMTFPGGEPARVLERATPPQRSAQDLEAYVGTFHSEELGVNYEVVVEEGALRFSIARHESHELSPLFDELFASSDHGVFEFRRGPDGTVEGFKLDAGRVRNLEFVRQ